MGSPATHGLSGVNYAQMPFFIRRMDTGGSFKAAEMPPASFPLVCFAYLTDGELLVDVEGVPYQCTAGQLLLIPEKRNFEIRYYEGARGYVGGFSASMAGEHALIAEVRHYAFWFDEASFTGELFNMMAAAFGQNRNGFIINALHLLLSMLPATVSRHPLAGHFLEQVFNPELPLEDLDTYSSQAELTPNGFCRMIRRESGRSPGEWIGLARLTRAKHLLQESDMSVIDIAWAVGLSDQSYFSRFFRRHTGLTPTEFRKKMRSQHK